MSTCDCVETILAVAMPQFKTGCLDAYRGHAGLQGPAHDPTRVQVQNDRHIQPAFCRPDVGKVGHPFLVRRVSLELSVEHVVCNGAALAMVLGQATPPRPGAQRLCTYGPLDAVQATAMAQFQPVMPYAPGAIGAIAAHEALPDLATQHLIRQASCAPGPFQPCVIGTTRDTERPANDSPRPDPSVLRDELKLYSESLAK